MPGNANNDIVGGVDPNMDPELAMVIRISLEEEKARQEAKKKAEKEKAQTEEN